MLLDSTDALIDQLNASVYGAANSQEADCSRSETLNED